MISLNINITKLERQHFTILASGRTFAKVVAIRLEETDTYGNQWRVTQGVSMEAKKAGERGPIIGSGKNFRAEHDGPMIVMDVCLTNIDKTKLVKGEKGSYLNCHLAKPTKSDETDADYIVRQDATEEERLDGRRGAKIGVGYKRSFTKTSPRESAPAAADDPVPEPPPQEQTRASTGADEGDDIPF